MATETMPSSGPLMIVPMLPPAVSGVGDYAVRLAGELKRIGGVETHFLNVDRAAPTESIDGFAVSTLDAQSATSLINRLGNRDGAVVLQYSGYGYQKRGCPRWLVSGLESWHRLGRQRRLITMFHELAAFGPPWTSAFWLSMTQRSLAARLARLSDRCLTNRRGYAQFLEQARGANVGTVLVYPVFSNVGEPDSLPAPSSRSRRLVVFGSAGWRQRAFGESMRDLEVVVRALRIEEVADVGEHIAGIPERIAEAPVRACGWLDAQATSALLRDSLAGFFTYPPNFLAKSGIFAAYAAHGLVPVGATRRHRGEDGLVEGTHYLLASSLHRMAASDERLQSISSSVRAWYELHSLARHAEGLLAILQEPQSR